MRKLLPFALLFLGLAIMHTSFAQLFNNQDVYSAPGYPVVTAVGDFNKDGIEDLATANYFGVSVSIRLGVGNGSFGPAVTYPLVGSRTGSVAIGDLNKDGKQDLVLTQFFGSSLFVMLGNGDGTFQSPVTYNTNGSSPYFVAVDDLNGDGNADVVTENYYSSDASVFFGNGNGTLQTAVLYPTGSTPYHVVIADLNKDGKKDLVTANSGAATISVLLNNGNGTFAPKVDYQAGSSCTSVALDDFNKDGNLDAAVSSSGTNSIAILFGTGAGQFNSPTYYPTSSLSYFLTSGDFDNDGNIDLCAAGYNTASAKLFLGSANGIFSDAGDFAIGASCQHLSTGDFNKDGRRDIIASNYMSNTISVLLNNGPFPAQPAGALNFDGVNDYITVSNSALLNLSEGNYSIEFWAKPTIVDGTFRFLISKDNTNSELDYLIGINNTNRWRFISQNLGVDIEGGPVVAVGNWYHVAAVFGNGTARLYINGTQAGSATITGVPVNTSANLIIGARTAASPNAFFGGEVEELRIWKKTLCEVEINGRMNCELAATEPNLVANYHFNQGTTNMSNIGVTTLTDASGNNLDGTLNNFSLNGTTSNWVAGKVSGTCSSSPIACPVTPASISGLDLWLKADAGVNLSGGNVTTWLDQSGNNRDASATNVQWLADGFNGKPVLRFTGAGGLSTPAFVTFPNKRGTIFVVSRTNGPGNGSGIGYGTLVSTYFGSNPNWQFGATPSTFGYYDGATSSNAYFGSLVPTNFNILTLLRDENTSMKLLGNGNQNAVLTIADNQPVSNSLKIGWNSSQERLVGDIAEIIVYGSALSPSEISTVTQYLGSKYNIGVATTAPAISVDKSAINFGNLGFGFTLTDSVVITNTGTAPLNFSGITSSNPAYSVLYYKNTLAPNDTTHLIIQYSPTAFGSSSGTITINHNAAGSPTSVNVQGNAMDAGYTYKLNQLPGYTGNLYGASWFSGLVGFACGAGGGLFKTTDGGLTWTKLAFNNSIDLRGIRCFGSQLWLFGSNGHVCVSHDRGQTFVPYSLSTSETVNDGYFVNSYYGFAVGGNRLVRRFNGTGWQSYSLSFGGNFYGVYAYGNLAWAVGSGGGACRYDYTTDSWLPMNIGVTNDIYGVGFCNENFGYVVGSGGLIYRTVNGGTSWSPCNSGVSVNIKSIRCLSARVAWACCEDGTVLQTTDGGATWLKLPLGKLHIERIDFNDGQGIGVCHGGVVVIFKTNLWNGSYNPYYVRRYTGSPYGFNCGYYSTRLIGGLAGRYGNVFVTTDGGQNWNSTNPYTTEDINCIRFVGENTFIAGCNGYLARCGHLGVNWVRFANIPANIAFYSMAFHANGTGWAVGTGGIIYYYNGTEWLAHTTLNCGCTMRYVYVVDDVAYAVGTGGTIWKYDGNGWINVSPTGYGGYDFYGCAFATPLIGYAVGNSIILKTDDGGVTWRKLKCGCGPHSFDDDEFLAVEVGCKLEAVIVGKHGVAYKTTDGGETWTDISLQRDVTINSVTIKDGEALLAAEDGEVYSFQFGSEKVDASLTANGPATFCQGGNVTLTASGGSNYQWSSGETTPSITVAKEGTYKVTVSNEGGCSDEKEMQVTVNPLPEITFNLQPTICINAGSLLLSASPASGIFSGPGVSENIFDPVAATTGTKSVAYTYTDGNGCTNSTSQSIIVNGIPTVNAGADQLVYFGYTPLSCATLNGSANGSASPYALSWSNGAATAITKVCPTATTTYTLTATDANGCSNKDDVVVNVKDVRCSTPGNDHKVVVCHTEPRKQNVTICVDENAVPTHLAHGDYLGVCVDNRSITSASASTMEMLERETKQPVIYPNPSNGHFSMKLPPFHTSMRLRIMDSQGRLIEEKLFKDNVPSVLNVALNKVAKGLYIVELLSGGEARSYKLLIQ